MDVKSQELRISNDMVMKAIEPNEGNNQGLFNCYKIRLYRLSGAVHFIVKNHIKRFMYNLFFPRK